MIIIKYLIITKGARTWDAQVKVVSKLTGKIPANAIPIKLQIDLPNSLFEKPQLEASIKIKESDVSKPVITADVLNNVKEVFEQNLAIEMTVAVVGQAEGI